MGTKPPLAAKRDNNESDIFTNLRAHGIYVYPLDVPLDALAYFRGVTYLVEIKNGPKAPFTPAQIKFLAAWPGTPVILRSFDDSTMWAKGLRSNSRTGKAT